MITGNKVYSFYMPPQMVLTHKCIFVQVQKWPHPGYSQSKKYNSKDVMC